MPTINVIPSWTVKKLSDDQVLVGTLQANGVYKINYTRDGVSKEEVFSIKDVKPITAATDNPETEGDVIDYTLSLRLWSSGMMALSLSRTWMILISLRLLRLLTSSGCMSVMMRLIAPSVPSLWMKIPSCSTLSIRRATSPSVSLLITITLLVSLL